MTLQELIDLLGTVNPDRVCEHAFCSPHSWRGIYDELAFEPATNRSIKDMLADAKSALGATYVGYSGGKYRMDRVTEVHVAEKGRGHDFLPEYGIRWMLGL